MSQVVEILSAPIPEIKLVLHDVNEQGDPVQKEFRLVFDYRAIKRAEDALGIDLKNPLEWSKVRSHMTPQLIHAGMARFHADVPIEVLLDLLNPGAQVAIQNTLYEYLFPGLLEQMKKASKEAAEALPKNDQSGASENA